MLRKCFLIFLIAFAITIQNTCPYGWAAKTIFISPSSSHCAHCPIKEAATPARSSKQDDVKKDFSNLNQLFVLHISKPAAALQIFPLIEQALSLKSDQIEDVYLEPLLRPPVLSLFS